MSRTALPQTAVIRSELNRVRRRKTFGSTLRSTIFALVTAIFGRNILLADGTYTGLFSTNLKQGAVAGAPEEGHEKALAALKQIRGES